MVIWSVRIHWTVTDKYEHSLFSQEFRSDLSVKTSLLMRRMGRIRICQNYKWLWKMNFFPIDHTIWIIHNSYFQRDLDEINIFLGIQKVFFLHGWKIGPGLSWSNSSLSISATLGKRAMVVSLNISKINDLQKRESIHCDS